VEADLTLKLKTIAVTLGAAAFLAGPALAQDGPGNPGSPAGGDPGQQQTDRAKDNGKKGADVRRLIERAKAQREQVLRHLRAEAERIARDARAACGTTDIGKPSATGERPRGSGEGQPTPPSDSVGAACEQAKQQAKAQFATLVQQTKADLQRIDAELKAALQRLRGK
jgi:cell division septum initiation protein DivIVA